MICKKPNESHVLLCVMLTEFVIIRLLGLRGPGTTSLTHRILSLHLACVCSLNEYNVVVLGFQRFLSFSVFSGREEDKDCFSEPRSTFVFGARRPAAVLLPAPRRAASHLGVQVRSASPTAL